MQQYHSNSDEVIATFLFYTIWKGAFYFKVIELFSSCLTVIVLENDVQSSLSVMQLADFGLSTTFGHGHLLKTYCGSPLYASPEIVNARPYIGPEVTVYYVVFCAMDNWLFYWITVFIVACDAGKLQAAVCKNLQLSVCSALKAGFVQILGNLWNFNFIFSSLGEYWNQACVMKIHDEAGRKSRQVIGNQ